MTARSATGPLAGVRVVELASIGPIPFLGMVLADLGAEVLRVARVIDALAVRPGEPAPPDPMHRNRRSIAVDLKHPRGADVILRLVERSDVLVEGFRPGVTERLGIGPDACHTRNPRLVYARLTGWGQDGPLADAAGHDIDYIALAGALHPIGRAGEPPVPPMNLVGDFAGGSLLLAVGIVSALLEASRSGEGQVVDAAMVDGAALLMAPFFAADQLGVWGPRGTNLLDTGAPFYEVYETADHEYVAVGAIEPKFYAALLDGLDLSAADLPDQYDQARWPETKARFAAVFRTRTRDEWCARFEASDACVAPVLSLAEAPGHPHNQARRTFVDIDGYAQPAPAPRFSRTPTAVTRGPCHPGAHTDEALVDWGFSPAEVAELRDAGAVA